MEELPDLHWGDHRICKIGGESIMTMGDPPDRAYWWGMVFALGTTTSRRDRFVMLKSRGLIDLHRAIIDDLRPERIFQLGIFQGGSVVLVNELASPRKLVAIDLSDVRIDALDQ